MLAVWPRERGLPDCKHTRSSCKEQGGKASSGRRWPPLFFRGCWSTLSSRCHLWAQTTQATLISKGYSQGGVKGSLHSSLSRASCGLLKGEASLGNCPVLQYWCHRYNWNRFGTKNETGDSSPASCSKVKKSQMCIKSTGLIFKRTHSQLSVETLDAQREQLAPTVWTDGAKLWRKKTIELKRGCKPAELRSSLFPV